MATPKEISELKQKMRDQRDQLLALLEPLSEAEAERPTTGEGEWTAKQQMSHLCEMETTYRAWVRRALEEPGGNIDRVAGEPPAIPLERANVHTVAEHVAEMRRQREETLAFIESISTEQFENTATQRMFGTLTVMQWLRSYYRHDRMHCDQVIGREPEYKPRYAGGSEPDQRRA
jgi:hypothetical protein